MCVNECCLYLFLRRWWRIQAIANRMEIKKVSAVSVWLLKKKLVFSINGSRLSIASDRNRWNFHRLFSATFGTQKIFSHKFSKQKHSTLCIPSRRKCTADAGRRKSIPFPWLTKMISLIFTEPIHSHFPFVSCARHTNQYLIQKYSFSGCKQIRGENRIDTDTGAHTHTHSHAQCQHNKQIDSIQMKHINAST